MKPLARNKLHTHPLPAVTPDKAGWYKSTLSLEGSKGFMLIPPVMQNLVLVPRLDREFVTTFKRYGHGARFEVNFICFQRRPPSQ